MPTLRTNVGSTSDNVGRLLRAVEEGKLPHRLDEGDPEETQEEPEVTEESESDDVAPVGDKSESEPEESESEGSEPEQADEGAQTALERPHNTFGKKEEWYAYRLAQGYTEEELAGLGRNDLRDTLEDR